MCQEEELSYFLNQEDTLQMLRGEEEEGGTRDKTTTESIREII